MQQLFLGAGMCFGVARSLCCDLGDHHDKLVIEGSWWNFARACMSHRRSPRNHLVMYVEPDFSSRLCLLKRIAPLVLMSVE